MIPAGAIRLLPLLLLLAGCAGTDAPRFELEEKVDKGPIAVVARLQKKELAITDTQRLVLEITAPAGIVLDCPDLEARLEDFRQVPWLDDGEDTRDGVQRITKHFAFELYESGPQAIPPFEVRYSSGAGEFAISGSLKTPVLRFTITGLPEGEAWKGDLAPPAGPARPAPFPWLLAVAGGLGAAALLAAAAWGILAWRRRRSLPPPPPPPAHELAYAELRDLVARHQAGELAGEAFVAGCSDALRRYVERRFGLSAPELTTEEFLERLRDAEALAAHGGPLRDYLEFADLVKFATRPVGEADIQRGFDFIKGFVEATREREAAP